MSDWKFLNEHRVCLPTPQFGREWCTTEADGFNGWFRFTVDGEPVKCLASDGEGWQHVSISREFNDRVPTWSMMCKIKALFWEPQDWVVQFHPAQSEYVNNAPHCLHLWRPTAQTLPTPPAEMVGFKAQPKQNLARVASMMAVDALLDTGFATGEIQRALQERKENLP